MGERSLLAECGMVGDGDGGARGGAVPSQAGE